LKLPVSSIEGLSRWPKKYNWLPVERRKEGRPNKRWKEAMELRRLEG
jgi:hypothetical protein